MFYKSYDEKIYQLKKEIFGVVVKDDKKEHSIMVELITNGDDDHLTYTITKNTVNEESVMIEGTGHLCKISYSENEKGFLEITTYLSGVEENYVKVEYGK